MSNAEFSNKQSNSSLDMGIDEPSDKSLAKAREKEVTIAWCQRLKPHLLSRMKSR